MGLSYFSGPGVLIGSHTSVPAKQIPTTKPKTKNINEDSIEAIKKDSMEATKPVVDDEDDVEEDFERVNRIYPPMKPIDGINAEWMDVYIFEDRCFLSQLAINDYLFDLVKRMFDEARNHVAWQSPPAEHSLIIDLVVRHFNRRAEYCRRLINEVKCNEYPIEVLEDVQGEVLGFMLMFEPFALNEIEYFGDDFMALITSSLQLSTKLLRDNMERFIQYTVKLLPTKRKFLQWVL